MASLLFIDTNVLLDFYRRGSRKDALSVLGHVDKNHDKIITNVQVEMEFMKNRRKAILDSLESSNLSEKGPGGAPAFLSHLQAADGLKLAKSGVATQINRLNKSVESILKNPARNDPIYKSCLKLFTSKSELNLRSTDPLRIEIEELAVNRFMLGYPPRKEKDHSAGDAFNWEWLVYCAAKHDKDVVIVSGDGDYGTPRRPSMLNEWLDREFRERVGSKRTVTLTDKLTTGLKMADIGVTKAEINTETNFLEKQVANPAVVSLAKQYLLPLENRNKVLLENIRSIFGNTEWNAFLERMAKYNNPG